MKNEDKEALNEQPEAGGDQARRETREEAETAPDSDNRGLSLRQIVGSMLAAALGVQSSKNRERDFNQGSPGVFIIAGLVFTALFIGGVYTIVTLVLSTR